MLTCDVERIQKHVGRCWLISELFPTPGLRKDCASSHTSLDSDVPVLKTAILTSYLKVAATIPLSYAIFPYVPFLVSGSEQLKTYQLTVCLGHGIGSNQTGGRLGLGNYVKREVRFQVKKQA